MSLPRTIRYILLLLIAVSALLLVVALQPGWWSRLLFSRDAIWFAEVNAGGTTDEAIAIPLPNATAGRAYEVNLTSVADIADGVSASEVPPGLNLHTGTGILSGTPSGPGEFVFSVSGQRNQETLSRRFRLFVLPALDKFGGVIGHACPDGPRVHFYTAKLNQRWVFCTPEGNQMWLISMFNLTGDSHTDSLGGNYDQRILAKYGTREGWASMQIARLKSWGFNAAGPYSDYRVWDGIPTFLLANGSHNSLANRWNLAPGPTKSLFQGVRSQYITAWGQFPDVFDPNFEAYWNKIMAEDYPGFRKYYSSPYLLGIGTDDRDFLFGFGAGPEVENVAPHPHLGRVALLTSPTQTSAQNDYVGQITFRDTNVYTKLALRDFLKSRYDGDIHRLNVAWNSSYTSWDSNGGWGRGTGLLDEDGRHSWTGKDATNLIDITPAMRADLDEFLYRIAQKYFQVTTTAIRNAMGKDRVLVFGPSTFNSLGLTFSPVLRAAGEFCDVIQASVDGGPTVVTKTYRYGNQRPLITWETAISNPDSALWRNHNPGSRRNQAARGELYQDMLLNRFNTKDPQSGDYPVAGIAYWAFLDNIVEKANFGFVSLSDNAYDGWEAQTQRRKCAWPLHGYTCGGEERNYGDFISRVRRAHLKIFQALSETRTVRRHGDSPGSGQRRP